MQKSYGFDYVGSYYAGNLTGWPRAFDNFTKHNQDWITAGALRFIDENADSDKPFFLYLATTLQHGPSPEASIEADRRISMAGLLDQAPDVQPEYRSIYERFDRASDSPNRAYALASSGLFRTREHVGCAHRTLQVHRDPSLHGFRSGRPCQRRFNRARNSADAIFDLMRTRAGPPQTTWTAPSVRRERASLCQGTSVVRVRRITSGPSNTSACVQTSTFAVSTMRIRMWSSSSILTGVTVDRLGKRTFRRSGVVLS